jgi:CheY-like chemotaxis protein
MRGWGALGTAHELPAGAWRACELPRAQSGQRFRSPPDKYLLNIFYNSIIVIDLYIISAAPTPDAAESLARLLRSYGDDVRTASDGLQGIAIAEISQPEFVLLDIRMPNLDGYETAKRIRQQPWGRDMVLLAFTAGSQWHEERLCPGAALNGHLIKPISPTDITTLLGNISQNAQR